MKMLQIKWSFVDIQISAETDEMFPIIEIALRDNLQILLSRQTKTGSGVVLNLKMPRRMSAG